MEKNGHNHTGEHHHHAQALAERKVLNIDELISSATIMGAIKAKRIRADSIVVAGWTWLRCRFGCPNYDRSASCPPRGVDPEHMKSIIAEYRSAILFEVPDGADVLMVARLEREAFLGGYYKAFGMGWTPIAEKQPDAVGACTAASTRSVRPQMAACSIDVFATALSNGFPIHVFRDPGEKPQHFGLLLLE